MELTGRLALVTGAGHRVGRAIALGLAARGMDVAVHYNASEDPARATARSIEELGRRARIFPANLAERGAPAGLVKAVSASMGTLDVVINSAAVMMRTPWDSVTEAAWDDMFALNLRAAFFVSQAAAMARHGTGTTCGTTVRTTTSMRRRSATTRPAMGVKRSTARALIIIVPIRTTTAATTITTADFSVVRSGGRAAEQKSVTGLEARAETNR